MAKKERKYVYLNNLNFDGTVFGTQVIDWLHLYSEKGLWFDIIQLFHIKELKKFDNILNQKKKIRLSTRLRTTFFVYFPSKGLSLLLNVIVLYGILLKYTFHYKEILIFSRGLFGKEISILKKIFPAGLIFYFDARAASAEENKYSAIKRGDFSMKSYSTIAHVHYTEYKTLVAAEKVFTVSKVLLSYFEKNYNIKSDKFVLYPCLSDASKFYLSEELRRSTRVELGLKSETKVFLYAGGVNALWHVTFTIFDFFNFICTQVRNTKFIFLTKDNFEINKISKSFPALNGKLISMSVENDQMVKYLNAADYGLLFRENTIMNNVASPTKFAEYMLCGLPVIISEGVGDYSTYAIEKKVGVILKESELKYPNYFDINSLLSIKFERSRIAELGKQYFAKQSIINSLIEQFKA